MHIYETVSKVKFLIAIIWIIKYTINMITKKQINNLAFIFL